MPGHDSNWKESILRLGYAFQVPDVRKRLIFVGAMFALFVFGLHIPSPFVNPEAMSSLMNTGLGGIIDIMSGGALSRLSILALGIVPYINASIIMQLLGIAVPSVQRLQKEGESGRKMLSTYTRWGTVILAVVQSTGLGIFLYNQNAISVSFLPGWTAIIPLVIVMTAGTSFLMWMGEQITDRGIGNGISLIIFAGIMVRLPFVMGQIANLSETQSGNSAFAVVKLLILLLVFLAIIVFITYVNQATRQIPIQHAKRVVGNRVFNSSNTYLPLKVVTAGVIPIIFAISLVMLPGTIAQMLQQPGSAYATAKWVEALKVLTPGYGGPLLKWAIPGTEMVFPFGAVLGGLFYFLLVVFFTYFYTAVVYNVQDIADNLKKNGSFVPGLRPGKQTERYIDMVLTRITFAGALFLGIVALLPYFIPALLGSVASNFPLWGGTSLLIVVGVALESMKQLEAHLIMRNYEGFIK